MDKLFFGQPIQDLRLSTPFVYLEMPHHVIVPQVVSLQQLYTQTPPPLRRTPLHPREQRRRLFQVQRRWLLQVQRRRLPQTQNICAEIKSIVFWGVTGALSLARSVDFTLAIPAGTLDLEPGQMQLVTYDPKEAAGYSIMGAEGTTIYKFTDRPTATGMCPNSTDSFPFDLMQDAYEFYGYQLSVGTKVRFSWAFECSLYFDVYLGEDSMWNDRGSTGAGQITVQKDGEYIFQVENSYRRCNQNSGTVTLSISRPLYDTAGAVEVFQTSVMGSGGNSPSYFLVIPPETPCTPKYCKETVQFTYFAYGWLWGSIAAFIVTGIVAVGVLFCMGFWIYC
ncbi:hypothetical protein PAPYR_5760 [Paratrimastix pyriformis]|uniref:Uncharacterized protein n=1 Tax=Paratrimastix pyriformis TaxID=342808 RepID=A0ABQ8UH37_9EUKA|nr:hypothetical protein PAPYR_5760 [Paratrimastix pyriformis]